MTNPPEDRSLREQLTDVIDTVTKLREHGRLLRQKLLFLVDQNEGLTQDQLVWFYNEITKMFPRRVRRPSAEETLDSGL